MKQIKLAFILLTASVLSFNSCKKSSNPVPAQNISMTFNGTAYSSATPAAVYSKSGNSMAIAGQFSSVSSVALVIDTVKVGTYNIGPTSVSGILFDVNNTSDTYYDTSGTIVVTAYTSTSITGTFQFSVTNGTNNATITSGKFNSNYTTTN